MIYNCRNCGKECQWDHRKENVYCSFKCQAAYARSLYVADWKAGIVDGNTARGTSNHIKNYIREKYNNSCRSCGISDWNGKPITLTIEHIDGDAYNSQEDNLDLLCPNCHSQTPTFAGRNKGKGTRIYRTEYDRKYAEMRRNSSAGRASVS